MEQRYSAKEALNRIVRLLKGVPPATDVPGEVTGEILSEDHALSELAELMAGSLPGEYSRLATSQYGEVYGVSGSSLGLETQTWTTIPFTNNGLSSDLVSPDQANDRITINDEGVYFVDFHLSYQMDVVRNLSFAVECSVCGELEQIRCEDLTIANNYDSVSAGGFVSATPGRDFHLKAYSHNGTGTFTVLDSQLNVRKVY